MRQLIDKLLAALGYERRVLAAPAPHPAEARLAEAAFQFGMREAYLNEQALARQREAYAIGMAQGEINGRMAVVAELAERSEDGPISGQAVTEMIARQLH